MSFAGNELFHHRVRGSSRHFFWTGLALVVLAAAAIVFPIVSTLVATLLVGWLLLLSGGLMLFGAFAIHGTGPFFGALLLGLLSVVAGAFLLFNLAAGALALTMVLAVLFMLEGAFEIVLGIEMRPLRAWVWMLLAGLASIVLGLIIAVGLPVASVIALGLVMGINFLSTGVGYLFLSREARAG